jgi:hypothetical protein
MVIRKPLIPPLGLAQLRLHDTDERIASGIRLPPGKVLATMSRTTTLPGLARTRSILIARCSSWGKRGSHVGRGGSSTGVESEARADESSPTSANISVASQ